MPIVTSAPPHWNQIPGNPLLAMGAFDTSDPGFTGRWVGAHHISARRSKDNHNEFFVRIATTNPNIYCMATAQFAVVASTATPADAEINALFEDDRDAPDGPFMYFQVMVDIRPPVEGWEESGMVGVQIMDLRPTW